MNTRNIRAALTALAASCAPSAFAAPPVLVQDATAFLQATSGAPLATQDFESYAVSTPLGGTQILPGVTVSATSPTFEARLHGGNHFAYAPTGRIGASSFGYDLQFSGGVLAVGLEVVLLHPNTGPFTMTLFFGAGADAPSPVDFVLPPTNPTETTPMFVGFLSDVPIMALRYREGLETQGHCCEETGIDRILVQMAPVPEPSAWALWLAGVAALGVVVRRRAAGTGAS